MTRRSFLNTAAAILALPAALVGRRREKAAPRETQTVGATTRICFCSCGAPMLDGFCSHRPVTCAGVYKPYQNFGDGTREWGDGALIAPWGWMDQSGKPVAGLAGRSYRQAVVDARKEICRSTCRGPAPLPAGPRCLCGRGCEAGAPGELKVMG